MNSKKTVLINSPAKLNLFLHVLGRLEKGYHSIESIFVPIDWYDEIYIKNSQNNKIERTGDVICDLDNDLLYRSANILKEYVKNNSKIYNETVKSSGCEINLKKNIPTGAGLGGGSSNAAKTLKILNLMWGLNLSDKILSEIGKELGADVPFFLQNKSCFVSGIGEKLLQLPNSCNLPHFFVVLVPNFSVSTRVIFESLRLKAFSNPINPTFLCANQPHFKSDESQDKIWNFGRNDMEKTTCRKYPAVKSFLDLLKKFAKLNYLPESSCRMSGTGGAVFCSTPTLALAEKIQKEIKSNYDKQFLVKVCQRLLN